MNLARILKNCQKGMQLYSPVDGELELLGVDTLIHCVDKGGDTRVYYLDGKKNEYGDVMLFPSKEQRDWNDFMIPFKNGDVIIRNDLNVGCKYRNIAIFSNYNTNATNKMTVHCQVNGVNEFKTRMNVCHKDWRLANPEEIQHFITRMHEANYDFKDGKLITLPKFEIGDTITNGTYTVKIIHVDDTHYHYGNNCANKIYIGDQDKWKIKKFDIHSLKPYDKILVKNGDGCWYPSLVSYVNSSGRVYTIDDSDNAECVIPFEGNEHLIGEYGDPDSYYVTWQE